ncbi:TonB-dependent receptor [Chitinophaga sp. Cy-1792]|uniref:SusC/RagA family TonB-linked outer membrane protein n=1 Tax=Chitinophaga sp. Cy-1792 TaxID=2608339 RepID=UPI001420DECC|nr:TonB-dependent receptor [Chitinophaga sp. Cy-1792]NIG53857.1 TonB-dependent receptor [Chitinophaga sp. Cy-1792]
MSQRLLLFILLLFPLGMWAQTKKITGTVKDDTGVPIPGISVQVKGKTTGAMTNASGYFEIDAQPAETLTFSAINYNRQEIPLNNVSLPLIITMASRVNTINDVVVVGYGTQKKRDLTGSISSVSTRDFKEQPVVNVQQILQGRAAGVQVVSNAGAPGGEVSVRIRGNNSIKGDNNPLYVIDGYVGADPSTVNPNDIETMDILKDASSTAIYGSRGANGVIVITTKRGKAGKTSIDFMSQFSSAQVLKKLDLLNAADFATTANANAAANGTTPIYTDAQIANFKSNGGTNWQDQIFRTAPAQEYQLSISGGNDKTRFYTSGNFLNQQGIIINSSLKRYALRAAVTSQLYKKLQLHVNAYAVRNETMNTGITGRDAPITQAIAWAPTVPVRDSNGAYTLNDPVGSISFNPVALATDQRRVTYNSTFATIAGLKYEFVPGLTFDMTGAVNYGNVQTMNYTGASISSARTANAGRGSTENIGIQSTNNLTYSHLFNNAHQLTVTGVMEYQYFTANGFNANGNSLTYPGMEYYNLALAQTYGVGTNYTDYKLLSYLGRVNYDYKGRYYFTAGVRRDGSSKFQNGNQYSTFPSVGAAWKLSEMDFMKSVHFLNNLKIRTGYGVTGNQAINPYQTLTTYTNVSTTIIPGSVTPGIVLGNPGNPGLKWETTRQWDLGIDADMFDNRLSLTADYYNKNTSNLLLSVPIPNYMGGGSVLSNVGKVNNRGIELAVSGDIIRNGSVTWNSAFNISFLRNRVVSLYSDKSIPSGTNIGSGLSPQPEFMIIPGQPLGTYWGLTYQGTWKPDEAAAAAAYGNVPGDSKYLDLDGNKIIDGSDYHIIGHGLPKYSWGFNNTINWKGFTLNIFVQSLGGYDKLDYTYAAGITANSDMRQATIADIKNRYIPKQNETSDIPAFSKTNKNYTVTTRFLEDGTFIRFKNISLSYELPPSMVKQARITVYLRAANFITITKYKGFDPETNSVATGAGSDVNQSIDYGSYPNAKTITAGVKIGL